MNVNAERSQSIWMATDVAQAPALDGDENADVVVVGAGIAGLSTAYELVRAGRSVVVIDRGDLGGGMTARTSAHLTSQFDDYYHRHIRLRGEAEARMYWQSQASAIDRIETIQRTEKIDCDFARIDGYLIAASGSDGGVLASEIEACHQIGFTGVAWAERAPVPGVDTGRCLRFPGQARFHPLKYLNGLIRCIRDAGGRLYADTAAHEFDEDGRDVTVEATSGHIITARAAVVATNSPVNDWIVLHSKQAPYRTYVIAARIPADSVADALYWDTEDPYHYVRVQPSEDGGMPWLIVGGEDHKSGRGGDADARHARLEAWARRLFPGMREVGWRWSGQVMEPVDNAPLIGRNPGNRNIYVVTGDSGEGLTSGVVASLLIGDLIAGRDNPWTAAYAPGRVTLRSAVTYVSENATTARSMTRRLTRGDVGSVSDVAPGHGAIVRRGRQKVAVFRDEAGGLHACSAICSHAGCVVRWNDYERCWDCPCHGSQFSVDGDVLNGPAIHPLAPYRLDD